MRASVAMAVATSLVVARTSEAHEPGTYGFGSRAASMGGAVAADVNDFSANYYNPAGLVDEEGVRIGVGYFWAENNLRISGRDSGVKSAHGVTFGLAASGRVFGLPIGVGLATHIPDEGLSRLTALPEDVPRWELYDSRATVLYLAANIAIRPWDFLEIGGGMSLLLGARGRFEITGTADFLYPYDSQLRHEVDVDLTSVRYPQAGVLVHIGKAASMALVYRGQTDLDLRLDGKVDISVDAAGFRIPLAYELRARSVQAFLPQQLVVGASVRPHASVHVNADVTWVNWSAYENPTARTIAKLKASVPPGLPVELPGDLRETKLEQLYFSDRIVPRLGVEWYLPGFDDSDGAPILRVPVRAGFVYEKSPVPPQTGVTNLVDSDRFTGSVGIGVEIPALRLALDVHAAISDLPERITLKKSAANLVGDYRAEGEMLNLGATLKGLFK